jgi:hypothetical protein
VRACGNRHRSDDYSRIGVDHAHCVVIEIANVSLCRLLRGYRLHHLSAGTECEKGKQYARYQGVLLNHSPPVDLGFSKSSPNVPMPWGNSSTRPLNLQVY